MSKDETFPVNPLPGAFVWRGITLERVVYRQREGGGLYGFGEARVTERPSDPPIFSGTVGAIRYETTLQADQSWTGRIVIGGGSSNSVSTFANPSDALDDAACWWLDVVDLIPSPAEVA